MHTEVVSCCTSLGERLPMYKKSALGASDSCLLLACAMLQRAVTAHAVVTRAHVQHHRPPTPPPSR